MQQLSDIVEEMPMKVIATVINKEKHKRKYVDPHNPYSIALLFCMERVIRFLKSKEQTQKLTHIVFETRGKQEDKDLELEFRRICDGDNYVGEINFLDIVFVDKKANSTGLQIADLIARPIGLRVLRPEQNNRAYDIIKDKFYSDENGNYMEVGLKIFP
jgi:hypothetical protein